MHQGGISMDEPIRSDYWVKELKYYPVLEDVIFESVQVGSDDNNLGEEPDLESKSLKDLDKTIKCERCGEGVFDLSELSKNFSGMTVRGSEIYSRQHVIPCSNPKCLNGLKYKFRLKYKEPKKKAPGFKEWRS